MIYLALLIIYLFVFSFGVCIGSFLNVIIYRLPNHISIARDRSFCPNCHTKIKDYDLIPIFSYLVLKGKCRHCQASISPRYPLVESFMGLIAVWLFMHYGFSLAALLAFCVASILTAIALIDFDTMTIPNSLIIALIIPALLSLFIFPDFSLLSRIIGFFVISLPMFLINLFREDAFGGGDIKLIAVCGFLLAWQNTLVAMFIALVLASIASIYLLSKKQKNMTSHLAFGPYLCLGIIIALVYGQTIITFYLSMFNLS